MIRESKSNLLNILILLIFTFFTISCIVEENNSGPVKAFAYCMPGSAEINQTICLSPYGSVGESPIIEYLWDLDGDGNFETDATNSDGYTQTQFSSTGYHKVYLRVSDGKNIGETSISIYIKNKNNYPADYDDIFDKSFVSQIFFKVKKANWEKMWNDLRKKITVPMDIIIDGVEIKNCGVRFKGNSSLNSPHKKSFKIDIDEYVEDQEYKNLKNLIFNNGFKDPSLIREKLAYEIYSFAGVPSSLTKYGYITVIVDNIYHIKLGVYTWIEHVDKKYLSHNFDNKKGNLYKAEFNAGLTWNGDNIKYYTGRNGVTPSYSKENNEDEDDWSDLLNFIDLLNNSSDSELKKYLPTVFNVDGWLRYLAVTMVLSSFDSYLGGFAHNYYLYFDHDLEKFHFIPWDLNHAFGNFGRNQENINFDLYSLEKMIRLPGPGITTERPLFTRIIADDDWRRSYEAYIDLLLRNICNIDTIYKLAEQNFILICPEVEKGDAMDFTLEDFYKNWRDNVFVPSPDPNRNEVIFGLYQFSILRNEYIWANLGIFP